MQRIKDAVSVICDNKLPDAVSLLGCEYKIETDFKKWIDFFILHENDELSSEEKIFKSLKMYTHGMPKDTLAAYKALQMFAACDGLPRNASATKNTGVKSTPVFSYLYDNAYIYSDFLRYYGINLHTAEMHWYTFTALFDGLPHEAETKQRIAYRSVKLYEIKDNSRRNQISQIQASIRIPHGSVPAGEIGGRLW